MIVDFNHYTPESTSEYDLCIVGSGAASLAMLTQLFNSSLKVLVLEAGNELITEQNQALYDTINNRHPFPGSKEGRFRVFGGSTKKWGGQSLTLEPIDFVKRDWVPNSGWPITYHEVAKYYPAVDTFLNLFPNRYDTDIYKLLKKVPLKSNDDIKLKFSKWSPLPNLRENFRKQLTASSNITVIQNANVTSINMDDSLQSVTSLTVSSFNKKQAIFSARKFVLACGGIENARLLLASNKQKPAGVGNDKDWVGRCLQDHPNAHIATLYPRNKKAQHYFNYFYIKNTRFLPRFVIGEDYQKQNKLLNCSAYFSFISEEDNSFSIVKDLYRKYRRRELKGQDLKKTLKLFKSMPHLLQISSEYFFKKRVYNPNAVLKLNLMTESVPDINNRVQLSNKVDALGMPIATITWRESELLLNTFKKCTSFMQEYFEQLNMGEYCAHDWMHESDWFTHIKDAYHHIGTTRMSAGPDSGVVDLNCKVYGTENLYIAGSSVFPTSGHSNPTSTLLALAFRLIDHLKTTLHD